MTPGEKFGDLRISNPMGNMWVLLAWDGEAWRMMMNSFRSRNELLRHAVYTGLYGSIVGEKAFDPWTNSDGKTYQHHAVDRRLYTVRLNDQQVVSIGDATCHASPWVAPGVPSIGRDDKPPSD